MAFTPVPDDLIGWPADEALRRLTETGAKVQVLLTTSPRAQFPGASHRVIRQRLVGPSQVELVVAPFPTGRTAKSEA
jgi:hypothetical protein